MTRVGMFLFFFVFFGAILPQTALASPAEKAAKNRFIKRYCQEVATYASCILQKNANCPISQAIAKRRCISCAINLRTQERKTLCSAVANMTISGGKVRRKTRFRRKSGNGRNIVIKRQRPKKYRCLDGTRRTNCSNANRRHCKSKGMVYQNGRCIPKDVTICEDGKPLEQGAADCTLQNRRFWCKRIGFVWSPKAEKGKGRCIVKSDDTKDLTDLIGQNNPCKKCGKDDNVIKVMRETKTAIVKAKNNQSNHNWPWWVLLLIGLFSGIVFAFIVWIIFLRKSLDKTIKNSIKNGDYGLYGVEAAMTSKIGQIEKNIILKISDLQRPIQPPPPPVIPSSSVVTEELGPEELERMIVNDENQPDHSSDPTEILDVANQEVNDEDIPSSSPFGDDDDDPGQPPPTG